MKKPVGVTIIAILAAIGGVMGILGGFGLMALSGAVNAITQAAGVTYPLFPASIWGIILIVLGVLDLAGAYGAWNLKKWAWSLLIGLSVLGILQGLAFMTATGVGNLLGVAINGIILYYLFQVKDAFSS